MIDKETVDKILDTADIVDVVSDFVSLRRRGANLIGLCPFHDEKTPSFTVSPAKQFCHCFGCGKGGSPVGFVMEHEQLTYPEALRYLANKYHIEIHERELTAQEREAQSERESMLVLNDFAARYFQDQLHNTQEGKDIGLSYLYERGFSDATIKKFGLGYSPQDSKALYAAAVGQGFNRDVLLAVGLCIDDRRGGGFDRFRGRVMFPVMNVAGRVIAFGGRTMKKSKEVAKYLNSPESSVYVKNRELYGLFQSKRAIGKEDKCFLVEGYTDVISMHQAGIENVVASSGTSLTEGQIRAIHRFTSNVTVLYDGDSAGIHASLRGIDMLLAEGLSVKVLLLPDGEDPDGFARSHSASEFKQYIAESETDFISFKTRILLDGTERDPIKRAAVIGDVVKSISVIPDAIARSVYARECSTQLGIGEDVLLREIQKNIIRSKEEALKRREREKMRQARHQGQFSPEPSQSMPADSTSTRLGDPPLIVPPPVDIGFGAGSDEPPMVDVPPVTEVPPAPAHGGNTHTALSDDDAQGLDLGQLSSDSATRKQVILYKAEKVVMSDVVKYGMCYLCDTIDQLQQLKATTVIEFVSSEMQLDSISFATAKFQKTFDAGMALVQDFYQALAQFESHERSAADAAFEQALASVDTDGMNVAAIEKKEKELRQGFDNEVASKIMQFRRNYLEKKLCSHPDDDVRSTAMELACEKHQLSKIYSMENLEHSLESRLTTIIPEAILNLKNSLISCQIIDLQQRIEHATGDAAAPLLLQLQQLYEVRKGIARLIGERVVNPRFDNNA